jgi:hypothetical protein
MKEHEWQLVLSILDRHTILWCKKCAIVRHIRSQHSAETGEPEVFYVPGKGKTIDIQECIEDERA